MRAPRMDNYARDKLSIRNAGEGIESLASPCSGFVEVRAGTSTIPVNYLWKGGLATVAWRLRPREET